MYTVLNKVLIMPLDKTPLSAQVQFAWNKAFCNLLKDKESRAETIKFASEYLFDMGVLEMLKENKIDIPDEFTFANISYQGAQR